MIGGYNVNMAAKQAFEHIGGHPLIDFVNTEMMRDGQLFDQLASSKDVIDWIVDVGIVEGSLTKLPLQNEPMMLDQVRTFRRQMREMLATIIADRTVTDETIGNINALLCQWQGWPRLIRVKDGFVRQTIYDLTEAPQILGLLADTAAQFVANTDFRYVKRCGNRECVRYFLDTSRNHSRRWCSMDGCGNRMKARTFYARKSEQ